MDDLVLFLGASSFLASACGFARSGGPGFLLGVSGRGWGRRHRGVLLRGPDVLSIFDMNC